jgi:hypothetical protein
MRNMGNSNTEISTRKPKTNEKRIIFFSENKFMLLAGYPFYSYPIGKMILMGVYSMPGLRLTPFSQWVVTHILTRYRRQSYIIKFTNK